MLLLTATRAMLRRCFFVSYLCEANERLWIVMRDEGIYQVIDGRSSALEEWH